MTGITHPEGCLCDGCCRARGQVPHANPPLREVRRQRMRECHFTGNLCLCDPRARCSFEDSTAPNLRPLSTRDYRPVEGDTSCYVRGAGAADGA